MKPTNILIVGEFCKYLQSFITNRTVSEKFTYQHQNSINVKSVTFLNFEATSPLLARYSLSPNSQTLTYLPTGIRNELNSVYFFSPDECNFATFQDVAA